MHDDGAVHEQRADDVALGEGLHAVGERAGHVARHDAPARAEEIVLHLVREEGDGVLVGKGVVERHVLKVGLDEIREEGLDGGVGVGRVDKDGADKGLDDVGEGFRRVRRVEPEVAPHGRVGRGGFLLGFFLCEFELCDVLVDLPEEGGGGDEEMFMQVEAHADAAEELVRDHGHLVLRQPLRIGGGEALEEEVHGGHVEKGVAEELEALIMGD